MGDFCVVDVGCGIYVVWFFYLFDDLVIRGKLLVGEYWLVCVVGVGLLELVFFGLCLFIVGGICGLLWF